MGDCREGGSDSGNVNLGPPERKYLPTLAAWVEILDEESISCDRYDQMWNMITEER